MDLFTKELADGSTSIEAYDRTKVGAAARREVLRVSRAGKVTVFNTDNKLQKRTVTIGHADLTAAAATQTINIDDVLPANARIVGVDARGYTPFTGGSVSACVVDIGTSGDVDALVDGANIFAAAVDGGPSTLPAGIRPNKTFATAGAQLIATVIATGDDVADLTAGAVTIDVLFEVLP